MGEEKNTKTIHAKKTLTTGKEHIQGWTGGIHPLHLHSLHKEDKDLDEIFVMYLGRGLNLFT